MAGRRAAASAVAVAAVALLAPVGAADARDRAHAKHPKQRSIYHSKLLWATVNVCDTAKHPDGVGIRASMPGSGVRSERMFMRFQLQYYRAADKRWHNIGSSGDSGFVAVGSGKYRARQHGLTFTVPPPASGAYLLRGAVTFEWRRDGEVVRRARKRTRGGHPNTAGADPEDFSASVCRIAR